MLTAQAACRANTNPPLGLNSAQIARPIASLPLTAQQSLTAFAGPGGQARILTAEAAWLANTNFPLGLLRVLIAQQGNIQSLSMHPQTHAVIVNQARTRQTTDPSVCFV